MDDKMFSYHFQQTGNDMRTCVCVCVCVHVCLCVCVHTSACVCVHMLSFSVVFSPLWSHDSGGSGLVTKSPLTLATPWAVPQQAPQSVGFPRQEYWSRLPFPSPGNLHDPGIEPGSPALAGGFFTHELLGRPITMRDGKVVTQGWFPLACVGVTSHILLPCQGWIWTQILKLS